MGKEYKGLQENLERFKNDLTDEKMRLLFSIAYKQGYDQALSISDVSCQWKEIQSNKVRVFQLEDEPEIFYLIRIREDEYMIVFEDGYDQQTGKVEFANKQQVYDRYGINDT